ncbi:hypothetical protein QJS10_CPA05g01531 [Acorus calamus]|uniref:Uncharacterized protein n=1 Tax=Acorus calamus TaxID=4465 RepID=A0AAV9EVL1_ACOCL|nr:hypothetical protein QJS10_CPA05g01531 [Acorus calamus]
MVVGLGLLLSEVCGESWLGGREFGLVLIDQLFDESLVFFFFFFFFVGCQALSFLCCCCCELGLSWLLQGGLGEKKPREEKVWC